MNTSILRARLMFAPEHGGHAVKGGGVESQPTGDGSDQIADALGETQGGHRQTPGINDPGVPGSRTNPVRGEPQPESDDPVGRPTGGGSGAGS